VSQVQIFGTRSCAETRKALRFFKERRIAVHFNDLKQRAASKGELRRFVQKEGVDGVIDRDAKRFRNLGLHQAHYGPDRWLEILSEEPGILVTPLVRRGNEVGVGWDEELWRGRVDG
jgi:arsenate reductase-like glutaredoxin family protein